MDVDALKTFLAITDTGSFTGAGLRVGRTQSAVSQQIRKLEERLDCRLLTRNSGGTALTGEGMRLMPLAREVLDAHDRMLAAFGASAGGGRVAVGIPELYAERLVPLILPEFQAAYPDVEVSIMQDETAGLVRALRDGRLDITLYTDATGEAGEGDALYRSQIVWACAKDLRLEAKRPIPVVVWREGTHHRRVMLEMLERAGLPYRIALTTQSVSGILTAVEAGIGLGLVLEINLTDRMRTVPPDAGMPNGPAPVVYLSENPSVARNPAARALADHIRLAVPRLT